MSIARSWATARVVVLVLVGCTSHAPQARPAAVGPPQSRGVRSDPPTVCDDGFGTRASFALDRESLRSRGASGQLLAKLDESPYRYFRMLGRQVAARTCYELRDRRGQLPVVAVHGDAHVEQFVVTRASYGLEDFDQAGFGPAVVDLVRYGASLHMACRAASWPCDPDAAVSAFYAAYRSALDAAPAASAPPTVVARLRAGVPQDHTAWLGWADALFRPLPADDDAVCRGGFAEFVRIQSEIHPERLPEFFAIQRIGALEMGIGSALERKVLLRVRGPTDAPGDDVLLEARQAPLPIAGECVWRPTHGGSLHALLFMSLLGRRMPSIYGFVRLDESHETPGFWVQAWEPGYRELTVADVQSQTELEELASDAARQLAGHFWSRFPEILLPLQRRAQLEAFDATRERATTLSRELAAEVVEEWERFRDSR
ncbi:MAG: DUF2252 family protein [Deltaproteobacteria bacterium]|nr:DUF2252 family protein [Deltaproteobacteria bacterium]